MSKEAENFFKKRNIAALQKMVALEQRKEEKTPKGSFLTIATSLYSFLYMFKQDMGIDNNDEAMDKAFYLFADFINMKNRKRKNEIKKRFEEFFLIFHLLRLTTF